MNAAQRRDKIIQLLEASGDPVSASSIAAQCEVSRQVIVTDIALLRAGGSMVSATPRGYILERKEPRASLCRTIACRHDAEGLAVELYLIVDNGCGVLDVTVEHPVYGQLSGQLHIFSRYDADCFLKKLENGGADPLCKLTGGLHLHTVACPSEEAFQRMQQVLREKGILFENDNS